VGFASNLDVALDHSPSHRICTQHAPLALAVVRPDRERSSVIGGIVASFDPAPGFIGMVPARPAPEHHPHALLHTTEGALGGNVPMVIGPSAQERIELADQHCCFESATTPNQLPRFFQHTAHTLPRGPDEQFVSILAHSLSQKVKSLSDVRDERLFFRELESALTEKLDDDRFDLLLQSFFAP